MPLLTPFDDDLQESAFHDTFLRVGNEPRPLPHQTPPEGDWRGWLLMGGRNTGKSWAGTRWLHDRASEHTIRARIIAPTFGDAVASCVEGPSGILEASNHVVQWKPSHPGGAQLHWPNGSVCYVIGTPTPRDVDRLRAISNVDADLMEEAAANPQLAEVDKQARLSRRRLGAQFIATTTPRPRPTIKAWNDDPGIVVTKATSFDNPHADPAWVAELKRMYEGTRLYRQELLGEIVDDVEGALWMTEWLDRSRVVEYPGLLKTAVGVDPASGSGTTGIIVVGRGVDGHLYVLEDVSQTGVRAEKWASVAVAAATRWNAVLVAENDQGGDMVRAVLKASDADVPVKPARARGRGSKKARAEPVALLWEKEPPTAHLVGSLPRLEDEMTGWDPESNESPDLVDSCVWACTWLEEGSAWSEVEMSKPSTASTPRAQRRPAGFHVRR